ncbi:hypothetical protein [Flavobacterium sp.]|uniref:hypothetical protein n=1 Tax=Flavobacterium sp. TaxID=239 RepID=UPI00261E154D|nr:hypothetical protein [Flavobacterium sp.]
MKTNFSDQLLSEELFVEKYSMEMYNQKINDLSRQHYDNRRNLINYGLVIILGIFVYAIYTINKIEKSKEVKIN